jgi:hypothetical protein
LPDPRNFHEEAAAINPFSLLNFNDLAIVLHSKCTINPDTGRHLILQQQLIFQPCIFSSSANGRVLIGIYDVDYLTFALTKAELMDVDS